MDYFIELGMVGLSSVVASSSYETFHSIIPKERQSNGWSLQELFNHLVPSTPLLVSSLVASLFYLLAAFLLAQTVRKCFNSSTHLQRPTSRTASMTNRFGLLVSKQFRSNLRLLRRSRVFRVLLITYVLSTFLVQIMLSMNISTEKIVVDTTDFIHSEESLRNTKRTPCFTGREFH